MIANTPLSKGWWTVVYLWCRGLDRTTPRSAPWIVIGYCNFTVFLLPTNFIVNFAEHPVTQCNLSVERQIEPQNFQHGSKCNG